MNETLGKIHFVGTFVFTNGVFYMMHQLGIAGLMRRTADPYAYETYAHMQPMNQFISYCAFALLAFQIFFVFNFFHSLCLGQARRAQPLEAPTASSGRLPLLPGHGNFDKQIEVLHAVPTSTASPDREDRLPARRPCESLIELRMNRGGRSEAWPGEETSDRRVGLERVDAPLRGGRSLLSAVPLVLFGGSVTTLGAGMAVEGWLVAEGHFLLFFPIESWFRDTETFVEHTHRLFGVLVGLFAVLAVGAAFRSGSRRARVVTTIALLCVVGQGAVGGFRVLEDAPELAFMHGVLAQGVFAMLGVCALVTSRAWASAPTAAGGESVGEAREGARGLRTFALRASRDPRLAPVPGRVSDRALRHPHRDRYRPDPRLNERVAGLHEDQGRAMPGGCGRPWRSGSWCSAP